MDMKEALRGRTWPTRPEGVNAGDYGLGPYVREGHVVSRRLCLHQSLSEPIPEGECAITSLCRGSNGKIYGATSGKRSHLFYYDPGPGADGVCDVGVIEGATAVRRALVATDDGRIFGGISESADGNTGGLFAYEVKSDQMSEGATNRGQIERLEAPVPGEGIAALAIDNRRQCVYGLSSVSGTLFVYDVREGEVSIKGEVDKGRQFSRVLVTDKEGGVYGAGACGAIFKFDPDADTLTHLPVKLPTVAGRDFYNQLDSAALDERSGLIYGGGSADGVIFVFDPDRQTIRSLGKVTAEPRFRAITVGLDGRVYGVSGDVDGMAHLFCYHPRTHELADLGIPFSASEAFWHGYEFDAACTGPFGEIYLGESERVSHLFIYFPPIEPPVCDEA